MSGFDFLVFFVKAIPRGNSSGSLVVSDALKRVRTLPGMNFCSMETSATSDAAFEDDLHMWVFFCRLMSQQELQGWEEAMDGSWYFC